MEQLQKIYIMGIPKGEERERQGQKKSLKLMAETFPKVRTHNTTDPGTSLKTSRINNEKSPPRYLVVKMQKNQITFCLKPPKSLVSFTEHQLCDILT